MTDPTPSDERVSANAINDDAGPTTPYMVPLGKMKKLATPCRHAGCFKELSTPQAEANHAKSCVYGKEHLTPPMQRGEAPLSNYSNPNHHQSAANFVEIDQATPGKRFLPLELSHVWV